MNAPVTGSIRPPWSATEAEVEAFLRPGSGSEAPYADPGPFAHDVKAGKNTALYNAHAYHTKVPPTGIVPYLEHYTRPGEIVLDPFCGSGMTGVACLLTGRRALLNDLSPAATHIAANYVAPLDVAGVRAAWARVETLLAAGCDGLYDTRCERCGGPATIQDTVWSESYGCGNCGAEIVLWDAAVVRELRDGRYDPPLSAGASLSGVWRPPSPESSGKPRGAVVERFACPGCGREAAKTELQRRRSLPVLITLECRGSCRLRRSARAPLPLDLEQIAAIEARPVPHWVPEACFDEEREMWRGGHRDSGIIRARDFWTRRNLIALSVAWDAIGREPAELQGPLRFAFTASAALVSRMRRFRTGGAGGNLVSGTLYIPSLSLEVNVPRLLRRKLGDFLKAQAELTGARRGDVIVQCGSATRLTSVPDASIDYVFTDPPFGSNIFYADCSFPWEAWLGYFTDDGEEAVWNKSRKPEQGGKTLERYAELMTASFREMQRALKPGRWASVVFHNSDDRVWDAIRDAATSAGFELVNAVALDKEQRSFKGIKGEKGEERVTNFDIILNLRKPPGPGISQVGSATLAAPEPEAGVERPPEAAPVHAETDERIAAMLAEHLSALAAGHRTGKTTAVEQRSTQFLHSFVIRRLLSEGLPVSDVSYERVADVAARYFKSADGRWYGREEAVGSAVHIGLPGLGNEVRDEASAIAWVRERIRASGPQLWGDLLGALQRASLNVRFSRPIEDLLKENFVLDRRQRWQLPTEAQLRELGDVQRRLLQERVERWLAGLGGAPRDGAEKVSWFERLFDYELHALAHAVFQQIYRDEVDAETWERLRRRDRVSAIRAGTPRPPVTTSEGAR